MHHIEGSRVSVPPAMSSGRGRGKHRPRHLWITRRVVIGLLLSLPACTGCAVCASPYDYAYAAYGGRISRQDRFTGRVGSLFDPAAAIQVGRVVDARPSPNALELPLPEGVEEEPLPAGPPEEPPAGEITRSAEPFGAARPQMDPRGGHLY